MADKTKVFRSITRLPVASRISLCFLCAIIGSGKIGTDLMIKIMRLSNVLEIVAFVTIDAEPPLIMRDTPYCLTADADPAAMREGRPRNLTWTRGRF